MHRAPGLFTPLGLVRLTRGLDRCRGPRRLLLQYVPHAFGLKAMNVPFCAWFAARRQDERWVFFHEVVYPWSPRDPLRHQLLAGTTRVMLRLVAGAADRAFVSIPAWAEHLPGPAPPPRRVAARAQQLPHHGGSRGGVSRPGRARRGAPPRTLRHLWRRHLGDAGARARSPAALGFPPPDAPLGRGSEPWKQGLLQRHPELSGQLLSRDSLEPDALAAHLAACDLLVQPYLDGVSARRGTMMASLALGRPLITNTGHLTEPLWRGLGAVELVEGTDPSALAEATERLLAHPEERSALGARAAEVYRERFSLERTLEALLGPAPASGGPRA